jgi:transposase
MQTAADPSPAVLLVAIELSKSTWRVATAEPGSPKVSQHCLPGGDAGGLLALLRRLQERAVARLGSPVRPVTVMEAGFDGFWLHRFLMGHGVDSHVVDPASVLVDRRARRVKTDRSDAQSLLRALAAHLRGEGHACTMVRIPSVEAEDLRRQVRERDRLIGERNQHTNRIKALLFGQGIQDFNPRRPGAAEQLACLRTGDGRLLPPCLSAELRREMDRLALVERHLGEVEAERDALVEQGASQGSAEARILVLSKLKGIGRTAAAVLVREVFHRDFANRRQVASFFGLAPSPWSSGTTHVEQGISKSGSRRARSVMVELAWLWLRWQPATRLAKWFQERSGAARGRARKVLITAVARRLAVDLWRYLAAGVVPEGATAAA